MNEINDMEVGYSENKFQQFAMFPYPGELVTHKFVECGCDSSCSAEVCSVCGEAFTWENRLQDCSGGQ